MNAQLAWSICISLPALLWNNTQKWSWPDQTLKYHSCSKLAMCLCFSTYCRPQEQISLVLFGWSHSMIQNASLSRGRLSEMWSVAPCPPSPHTHTHTHTRTPRAHTATNILSALTTLLYCLHVLFTLIRYLLSASTCQYEDSVKFRGEVVVYTQWAREFPRGVLWRNLIVLCERRPSVNLSVRDSTRVHTASDSQSWM